MVAVKERPYAGRYRRVAEGLKHYEYVAGFIESRLGRETAEEFQRRVDSGLEPVPEDASPKDRDEMSRERVVMPIPHCKVLDYPLCEDVCLYGRRGEYPRWMTEQLKVKLVLDRRGTGCTATVTPLH